MAFYLLLPIAWLPLRVLYLLSDALYWVVYHLVGYRKGVVRKNLERSFPSKTPQQRKKIEKQYYHHLCDLLVEGIYNLRISPKELRRRYKILNPELLFEYHQRSQSIMLLSAHFNNWEYMVLGLGMMIPQHGVGVGKPLNSKRFGTILTRYRSRYGTEIVDQTNVREVMEYYHRYKVPVAYMMLGDQSPSNARKCYWTRFLHQDTGFLYGTEYFARKYNYPVVLYKVEKVKRGFYEITLTKMCENPLAVPQYAITEQYAQWLEKQITLQPQYWLWSHKRWKRQKPQEQ